MIHSEIHNFIHNLLNLNHITTKNRTLKERS